MIGQRKGRWLSKLAGATFVAFYDPSHHLDTSLSLQRHLSALSCIISSFIFRSMESNVTWPA
jgi:hypothetical protein